MKHLKKFNEEHIFKLKKPALLDYKVWNPISRGLRSEIVKSYEVDPSYKFIKVFFADDTDVTIKLKEKKHSVSSRVDDPITGRTKDITRYYKRFTSDMDNKELYKLLVKPINVKTKDKTSDNIIANGKTYNSKDVHELIQNLPSYQRLIELGLSDTSSQIQKNRGTVILSRGKWPNITKYQIYKTGKIYKGSAFQPMYNKPPFETLEDYDKALQAVLFLREQSFKKELVWWEKKYEENPASLINAPLYITKVLNKRLHNIAKTGLFQ